MELIRTVHPILAIILFLGYGFLSVQLFRRKQEKLETLDRFMTQFVRIALLLAYFTGLVMSMNMNLWVNSWHHYASLLPVAVMFLFQVVPQLIQKQINVRGYAFMFLAMFLSIVFISITSGIIHL